MIVSNDTTGPLMIPVTLTSTTAATTPIASGTFGIVSAAPNPFNPSTTVTFHLPKTSPVTVEIWSVDGRLVRTLASERLFPAGENKLVWNGSDSGGELAASGVYYIRLSTPGGQEVTKAVLLK
jgi:hypothetical protein